MSLRPKAMHRDYAPRYHTMSESVVFANTTSVTGKLLFAWPFSAKGKLVDIVFSQPVAGANGTSVTLTVKKNGTTVCTADAVLSQTDGNNATTGVVLGTKPAGATRPAIKTDGTELCNFGDDYTFDVATAGTYSTTFPTVTVTLVFDQQ